MLFFKKKKKQSMVEYGLIIALISIGVIGIISGMTGEVKTTFNPVNNKMEMAVSNHEDKVLAEQNARNVRKYRNNQLPDVKPGITPPSPSSGGGKGSYKDPTAPAGNSLPIANFKWEPEVPHPNQEVTFLNISKDPDGDRIVNEDWENKRSTYPPGEHVVRLRVADEKGNWSEWVSKTITVQNLEPNKPKITMTPNTVIESTTVVTFTAEATDPNGDEVTYEWENKRDTYPVGQHTVRVRAVDQWGLAGEWAEISFTVINSPPTKPTLTCTPNKRPLYNDQPIVCQASGSIDPDGDTVTYEYQNKSANNLYQVGTTKVRARAVDSEGNFSEWAEVDVIIDNRAPSAPLINPRLIERNTYYTTIRIEAYGSIDPDGHPITYEWQGKSPDDKYINGTHTVKVRARDPYGATSPWAEYTFETISPLKAIFENWDNYIRTGGQSGQWKYDEVKDEIYSTQNVGWTGFWNPQDTVLQNYRISFEMGVMPATDNDNIGMTFRMKDLKNMYFFVLDQGNESHVVPTGLYKITNGTVTPLVQQKSFKWTANKWYPITIEVRGNNIKIYHGNELIIDYTDNNSPFLNGAYGPFTDSQANAHFRNLIMDILD